MTEFTIQQMHHLIGHDHGRVIEAGCNEHDDTVKFVAEMPHATYHCFECDPRAIAKARAKGLPPNVHLHAVALADRCGVLDFNQSDGRPPGEAWRAYGPHWDKSGSLLRNHRHTRVTRWLKFLPPIQVLATTLDAWAAEYLAPGDVVDFLWADLQGAEAMMLRGAQGLLPRIRFLYAECDPRPLYHGMATLGELDELLPGFERDQTEYYGHNYLWRNTTL